MKIYRVAINQDHALWTILRKVIVEGRDIGSAINSVIGGLEYGDQIEIGNTVKGWLKLHPKPTINDLPKAYQPLREASNECGGFRPPQGHMDSQMYPECEGWPTDRNIAKKHRDKKKHKNPTTAAAINPVKTPATPATPVTPSGTSKPAYNLSKQPPKKAPVQERPIKEHTIEEDEVALTFLTGFIEQAMGGDENMKSYLQHLWPDWDWDTLKNNFVSRMGSGVLNVDLLHDYWFRLGLEEFKKDRQAFSLSNPVPPRQRHANCNCQECQIVEAKKQEKDDKGKKEKKWIQKAIPKENEGKFNTWCKKRGFNGVCQSCITQAIDIGGNAAKMANFAINVSKGKYHHPDKKK